MIKKVKQKDIEILKLNLMKGELQSDNTFKASIGQRGLNLRDIMERLNQLSEPYDDGTQLNFRFMIDRRNQKNIDIHLIGPTSTYQIRKVLGDIILNRSVNNSEIVTIYEQYSDYWNKLTKSKDRDKACSIIRGKLLSMGALLEN